MEVHNGRVRDGLRNSYCERLRSTSTATRCGLIGCAYTSGEIGSAATIVDGDPRTASELVALLRSGVRLKVGYRQSQPARRSDRLSTLVERFRGS
ncbi:MAG: hypothetical protein H0V04_07965 [Chloroflexi bacterium]|nr:hypothetical protein [Chloroflexota bacterium]